MIVCPCRRHANASGHDGHDCDYGRANENENENDHASGNDHGRVNYHDGDRGDREGGRGIDREENRSCWPKQGLVREYFCLRVSFLLSNPLVYSMVLEGASRGRWMRLCWTCGSVCVHVCGHSGCVSVRCSFRRHGHG